MSYKWIVLAGLATTLAAAPVFAMSGGGHHHHHGSSGAPATVTSEQISQAVSPGDPPGDPPVPLAEPAVLLIIGAGLLAVRYLRAR